MKKKIISMIGLALFVGAVAFNFQMNSASQQTSDVTLKNIKAIAGDGYEDDNCLYGGTQDCPMWPDISPGEWYYVPNPY